jgi:hypothetical protein
MERGVSHLVRDTLILVSGYAALIAGLGRARIWWRHDRGHRAGALIALGLPLVFVYLEERELFHPHGRAGH